MDAEAFTNPSGRLIFTLDRYHAFVPDTLPRTVELDGDLVFLLSEADRSLGELAGMARTLPNPQLLVAPLSQREAVLSSRIEGTQASLSDLAIFEAAGPAAPRTHEDVLEVSNYRSAMSYGLKRLETLPISLRLVRELHRELLTGVRGQEKTPGEFRIEQNWIGAPGSTLATATFVPPPPSELMGCLSDWENFLHGDVRIPPIIQCALMHYQFEAIHPFLDGNGRVGRLLMVLFLCTIGRLPAPVLYLSPYFERYRNDYYDLLRAVSEKSAWSDWFRFFVTGVIAQCRDAFLRSERLIQLHENYRNKLIEKRAPPTAHKLLEELFVSPATTVALAASQLDVTVMSSSRAVDVLVATGILDEITGRRRDRIFMARDLLRAIQEDVPLEGYANQLRLLETRRDT